MTGDLFASDTSRAETTWVPGQSSAGNNIQTATTQDAFEWQTGYRKPNGMCC